MFRYLNPGLQPRRLKGRNAKSPTREVLLFVKEIIYKLKYQTIINIYALDS